MPDLAALLDRAMEKTSDISLVRDPEGRGWQANVRRGRTGNAYNVQILPTASAALTAALQSITGERTAPEPEEDDWKSLV